MKQCHCKCFTATRALSEVHINTSCLMEDDGAFRPRVKRHLSLLRTFTALTVSTVEGGKLKGKKQWRPSDINQIVLHTPNIIGIKKCNRLTGALEKLRHNDVERIQFKSCVTIIIQKYFYENKKNKNLTKCCYVFP